LRYKAWKREKPAWFTEAVEASIPTDMLPPREGPKSLAAGKRRSTIHDKDASLSQRLSFSLEVEAPAATRNQVRPEGVAAAQSCNSESSESDSESETPLPPPPPPPPHEVDATV
jgi:hypothetical protein